MPQDSTAATPVLTENEAFAGVLTAAMHTDNVITKYETQQLHALLSRMRIFDGWTDDQYQRMFAKLDGILQERTIATLMELSAGALSVKLRPTAFALAVDVTLADGIVMDEEKDFLYTLQQLLEIENPLAQKILEVIIIKNRG